MEPAWSTRIGWLDLPQHVRTAVEDILGSEVVQFVGQAGGFSPGTADRVLTSSGKRAFVKAVSRELNEITPKIHRQEAHIAGNLPASLPVASLLGHYDDGQWVALVLEDIEGAPPHFPWKFEEIMLVLDALEKLALVPVPEILLELPTLRESVEEAFAGWKRIRELVPEECDPWIVERLDELDSLAAAALRVLGGRSLVHNDVRADNILITAWNEAILVDWPWACIGAGWFDALTVLINVRAFDPTFNVDSVFANHPVFAEVTAQQIDAVLAGMAGYFIDVARTIAPAGLPTVRAFQQQQGDAVIKWLKERL